MLLDATPWHVNGGVREPDIDGAAVVPTFLTLASTNTVVNLGGHPTAGRPPREEEVERITWLTAQRCERVTGPDYVRAVQTEHRLGRQMAAFHERWDAHRHATGRAVR